MILVLFNFLYYLNDKLCFKLYGDFFTSLRKLHILAEFDI